MDDLLTRMLAIDKQGNAVVEEAEAEAVKIREAASAAQAQETEAFSAKLSEELAGIEQAAVDAAEAERAKELALVSEQVDCQRHLKYCCMLSSILKPLPLLPKEWIP